MRNFKAEGLKRGQRINATLHLIGYPDQHLEGRITKVQTMRIHMILADGSERWFGTEHKPYIVILD